METKNNRKIASNYIYLPECSLVKNGYVEIIAGRSVHIVDTGGQIKEVAGLEFYAGIIVPDYVAGYEGLFRTGKKMLPVLERLFAEKGNIFYRVAIIEKADLLELAWRNETTIRLL